MTNIKTQNWKKRFDEKFTYGVVLGYTIIDGTAKRLCTESPEGIKDFIQSEIDQALQERTEEIIKRLETMKLKEIGSKSQKDQIWGINHGLTKAISFIKKYLKNEKEKHE